MLVGVGHQALALSGHDVNREEVIAGQPVLAHQPALSATERQAGDTSARNRATCNSQSESLGLVIELAPGESGFGAHGAPRRVDTHAFHSAEVDYHSAVADGTSGDVVPTTTH